MIAFSMWLPVHMTRLICGLFFLALLQGCVTVEIGTSDICNNSKSNGSPLFDPTGCNPGELYAGSAVGFKDSVTRVLVPPGSPLMCSAPNSKKCNTNLGPGKCGLAPNSPPCIPWFRAVDNWCYCGCP